MLGICLDNVRKTVPLVHNITNYVTVNDVANILLACGGSPDYVRRAGGRGGHHLHLRRSEHQHRHPEPAEHPGDAPGREEGGAAATMCCCWTLWEPAPPPCAPTPPWT